MKKFYFNLFTLLMVSYGANAQNTYPYPATGSIGIGITAGGDRLTVRDAIRVATVDGHGGYYAADAPTGGNSIFSLTRQGNNLGITSWDGIGFSTNAHTGPSTAYNMFIDNSGRIGIGNSSPVAKLDITGTFITGSSSSNIDPANVNLNFLANSSKLLIGWNRSAGDGETDFIANQGVGGTGGFTFYNHDNSNVETGLLWIRGNGDVSIGTPNSRGYKLAVNGKIRATEIQVELSNWPDYVFQTDHNLPTLTEVKSYIDKNHHLPGIPSAIEVATKGINLGEINKALTQKIEELTLYLIEKDSLIKTEQQKNMQQEARLEKLEMQLNILTNKINSK
jgi:hypothetical protein